MTGTWATVAIAAVGLVLSVGASLFAAGIACGRARADVASLQAQLSKTATSAELLVIAGRLGAIESMFELRLREPYTGRHA